MNERSLEAHDAIIPHKKSHRGTILDEYLEIGPSGAQGQGVVRKLFGKSADNNTGRLSELKGVTLGHSVSLVRTGDTEKTAQNHEADILIHVAYATDQQIDAHIQWVREERLARKAEYQAWIDEINLCPPPSINLAARSVQKGNR